MMTKKTRRIILVSSILSSCSLVLMGVAGGRLVVAAFLLIKTGSAPTTAIWHVLLLCSAILNYILLRKVSDYLVYKKTVDTWESLTIGWIDQDETETV